MDRAGLVRFVSECWGDEIVPQLVDYIRIPNKSPAFDPDWAAHGYMEDAVSLWARRKFAAIERAMVEIAIHRGALHCAIQS